MEFVFRPLNEQDARAIAGWTYEPPYDVYNWRATDEPGDLLRAIPPIYAADGDRAGLAGFVCFGDAAQVPGGKLVGLYSDDALDLGLGLRPDLTGRKIGSSFVDAAVVFATALFGTIDLRLTVATFNERAIRVYERCGFQRGQQLISTAQGIERAFILMRLYQKRDDNRG